MHALGLLNSCGFAVTKSGCELLADNSDYPTILVVHYDRGFRDVLIRNLQQKRYLVLEAQNATEASEIVIRHSRQIHVLLADDSGDSRAMATTLKPYRPDMRVIHINSNLELNSVLMEVSRVLDPPPKQKKKRDK
jgi:DNA-binding NtrC family response regulator